MILQRILEHTRRDLAGQRLARPESELLEMAQGRPDPLSLVDALTGPGVSIIAEIKRASPSRGTMCEDLEPAGLAAAYAGAGAAAISVLTDRRYFCGSLEDLTLAGAGLEEAGRRIPLLRKDFIVDPYGLLEARAWGADAVLLIAAVLEGRELSQLYDAALDLGLSPLVEVHDEGEMARALELSPAVIGINNRDLRTFDVRLETTGRLRELAPAGVRIVSESGVRSPEDMRRLAGWGVDAALVGEALVTAGDPAGRLYELLEAGQCR